MVTYTVATSLVVHAMLQGWIVNEWKDVTPFAITGLARAACQVHPQPALLHSLMTTGIIAQSAGSNLISAYNITLVSYLLPNLNQESQLNRL